MRLEINAGGLGGFFNGINSFFNRSISRSSSNSLTNNFQTVINKTSGISGGVGSLGSALNNLQARNSLEQTRIFAVDNVRVKTDNFIQTAIIVDGQVERLINQERDALYRLGLWVKPEPKPTFWQRLGRGIKNIASKAWNGIVKFVKSPVGKIIIGVAVIAALAVATVFTGGTAGIILGAALSSAIKFAVVGAVSGALISGVSHLITTGGWSGIGSSMFNGAASGFAFGAIGGAAFGALSASIRIGSGATQIVGKAHGTILHKFSSNMQAGKMTLSGNYAQIGLNKSLKTMGLQGGRLRPDVIGVGKNGVNKLVEVVSSKQSITYVVTKMNNMLNANPNTTGVVIKWVRYLGKIF